MPGVPIVVTSSSTSVVGTTLPTLVDRLAETLGYYATGTVTTAATSLEAEQWVICDQFQSDQLAPDQADGLFLFVRDGSVAPRTQRRIVDASFDSGYGAFRVDHPFSAPLALGTSFEVAVLPREKQHGAEGLRHILNLALERLPVTDKVSMVAVAGQSQYPFVSLPYPVKFVTDVLYPRTDPTNEPRRVVPRNYWTLDQDADTPVLSFGVLPFTAGDTFEVELYRPASSWIRSGGIWGDSTTGLVLETDACLYDPLTVVNVARPIALQRLALRYPLGSPERQRLHAEMADGEVTSAFARFYGRVPSDRRQRVGAQRAGSGTWWANA